MWCNFLAVTVMRMKGRVTVTHELHTTCHIARQSAPSGQQNCKTGPPTEGVVFQSQRSITIDKDRVATTDLLVHEDSGRQSVIHKRNGFSKLRYMTGGTRRGARLIFVCVTSHIFGIFENLTFNNEVNLKDQELTVRMKNVARRLEFNETPSSPTDSNTDKTRAAPESEMKTSSAREVIILSCGDGSLPAAEACSVEVDSTLMAYSTRVEVDSVFMVCSTKDEVDSTFVACSTKAKVDSTSMLCSTRVEIDSVFVACSTRATGETEINQDTSGLQSQNEGSTEKTCDMPALAHGNPFSTESQKSPKTMLLSPLSAKISDQSSAQYNIQNAGNIPESLSDEAVFNEESCQLARNMFAATRELSPYELVSSNVTVSDPFSLVPSTISSLDTAYLEAQNFDLGLLSPYNAKGSGIANYQSNVSILRFCKTDSYKVYMRKERKMKTWSLQNAVDCYSASFLNKFCKTPSSPAESSQETDEGNMAFLASATPAISQNRSKRTDSTLCRKAKPPQLNPSPSTSFAYISCMSYPSTPSRSTCISCMSYPSTPELSVSYLQSEQDLSMYTLTKSSTPRFGLHGERCPTNPHTNKDTHPRRARVQTKLAESFETDSILNQGFSLDTEHGSSHLSEAIINNLVTESSPVATQPVKSNISDVSSKFHCKMKRSKRSVLQAIKRKLLCTKTNDSVVTFDIPSYMSDIHEAANYHVQRQSEKMSQRKTRESCDGDQISVVTKEKLISVNLKTTNNVSKELMYTTAQKANGDKKRIPSSFKTSPRSWDSGEKYTSYPRKVREVKFSEKGCSTDNYKHSNRLEEEISYIGNHRVKICKVDTAGERKETYKPLLDSHVDHMHRIKYCSNENDQESYKNHHRHHKIASQDTNMIRSRSFVVKSLADFVCDPGVRRQQLRVHKKVQPLLTALCQRCDITVRQSRSDPSLLTLTKFNIKESFHV